MRSVVRLIHKFTVLGLAFLFTLGVWCGGFANGGSAILTGVRAGRTAGCKHERLKPRGKEGARDAAVPRVFRSPVFIAEVAAVSIQAQDLYTFITIHLNLSEQFALGRRFHPSPQIIPDKISPHLLYSVLNL